MDAGRTAFLAGAVAANAVGALSAVGTRPDHVVRSVIYVASGDVAVLGAAWRRLTSSVIGPAFTTASTCWELLSSASPDS